MIDRKTREAWVSGLSRYPFSLFVTFKFPRHELIGEEQFISECVSKTEKYFAFVSSKCFGKKAVTDQSRAMKHVTFFEDMDRFGNKTILHAHTMIVVEQEKEARLRECLVSQWKKIRSFNNSPDPVIKKVTELNGMIRYNAKHSDTDLNILFNLPV